MEGIQNDLFEEAVIGVACTVTDDWYKKKIQKRKTTDWLAEIQSIEQWTTEFCELANQRISC